MGVKSDCAEDGAVKGTYIGKTCRKGVQDDTCSILGKRGGMCRSEIAKSDHSL